MKHKTIFACKLLLCERNVTLFRVGCALLDGSFKGVWREGGGGGCGENSLLRYDPTFYIIQEELEFGVF